MLPATMNPVTVALLGAGNRGHDAYGRWALAHPEEVRFVAVADADPAKRARCAAAHGIPADLAFASWEELLARPRLADAVLDALPDAQHEESAVAALRAGYDLLLEKPIAGNLQGTLRVARAACESGSVVQLGYVLRHTPFFETLREVVQSGRIGEIVTVAWRENVSSTHYGHSYVRGNWGREDQSSPMILAKCSHDLDLLGWITGQNLKSLVSYGSLLHFRPENAPAGAPERCLDGCPAADECPWYAPRLYLGERTEWPVSVISTDLSLEGRTRALQTGPYGRCVYRAGSDVVDNQVIAFALSGGGSGTLTMHGHSGEEGRSVRIDGTRATLRGVFNASGNEITIEQHDIRTSFQGGGEVVPIRSNADAEGGHGGGDGGLMRAFARAVRQRDVRAPGEYVESHLLAFAAERSRREASIIDLDELRRRALA
jgi:predicted dehydrogenase